MTSRQAGRRMTTIAAERQKRKSRRRGTRQAGYLKDEALRPKDRRLLLQVVICGSIFVLLVVAKLLLPAKMASLNQRISNALHQNMDVQTVFSVVGDMFTGQQDAGGAAEEVYQAVFHPETKSSIRETSAPAGITDGGQAALDSLRTYRAENISAETEEAAQGEEKTATEQTEVSTLAYVLYSDKNLPENVSLEQAILGFDYCTPLAGALTSDFGYREHPVEGEERFHYGVDLAADSGTAICCFAGGTVTAVGESSSYGKYCIVAHEGGYSTLYAHCSRITISSGKTVKKGEKIAEVGETGIATGPHLHFELQKDGVYLNPIYYVSTV